MSLVWISNMLISSSSKFVPQVNFILYSDFWNYLCLFRSTRHTKLIVNLTYKHYNSRILYSMCRACFVAQLRTKHITFIVHYFSLWLKEQGVWHVKGALLYSLCYFCVYESTWNGYKLTEVWVQISWVWIDLGKKQLVLWLPLWSFYGMSLFNIHICVTGQIWANHF